MPETENSLNKVQTEYQKPLFTLVEKAHRVLTKYFTPGEIQTSRLLSVKTGGCPEDCAYCPQAARYQTNVQSHALLPLSEIIASAKQAKAEGATRFCMGAAWRAVKDGPQFEKILDMVREVRALGLQVCCTLGMINEEQARRLKEAGLYAYNHNLDTSEDYYGEIISTRKYADRLKTIEYVRKAGMTVCTGGILGMGESHKERISFLHTLANLQPQPESVTINKLVPMKGTPLADQPPLPTLDLIRVVATARILIPQAVIRLSAGRASLSYAEQFLTFYAGANSIFLGEKLLTAPNISAPQDEALFEALDLTSVSL